MNRPLQVAHVVATAGRTGVESHLLALLSAFDRIEVEPTLFVPGPGPLVEALRTRGIPVEFGGASRRYAPGETRALGDRWRGRFDVVHAHGARAAFWALRAARRAGIDSTVATLHELRWRTLPPGLRTWIWIALEERALAGFGRLIAVSESVCGEVVARHPGWAPRIRVVHGTSPLLLEPLRQTEPPRRRIGEPLRLVTVGRLEWVKGHDRLLEGVSCAVRRGVRCSLQVIGDGSERLALQRRARALGIADRVRWDPAVRPVADCFVEADVFITATRAESLGLAVLEAIATGLPVIATRVGGLAEVIEEGHTGILVASEPERGTSDRIADAIVQMDAEPIPCERFTAARARTLTRFGPQPIAARVAGIYRELFTAARTGPISG